MHCECVNVSIVLHNNGKYILHRRTQMYMYTDQSIFTTVLEDIHSFQYKLYLSTFSYRFSQTPLYLESILTIKPMVLLQHSSTKISRLSNYGGSIGTKISLLSNYGGSIGTTSDQRLISDAAILPYYWHKYFHRRSVDVFHFHYSEPNNTPLSQHKQNLIYVFIRLEILVLGTWLLKNNQVSRVLVIQSMHNADLGRAARAEMCSEIHEDSNNERLK